ncbi:serine/threonine-protein kinase DDB_G0283821 [Aphidius gifuensis]|uniref:serine/threonine-protein kinase DDB_G0283821 n=1 Tax=Aphidius gifuensis TaxID=684658 RepID=UPI001CDBF1E7|nr:serine/threonine-protein kinase DDB_G0283821 [Aphidius gifuensis]
MTELTELKMNVAALKRVDPYIKDIIETATHVALYTFNSDNNEWEKTDIEGALFVYSRNGEPYNSILIMNRLNTNNLVEPVTQGLDLQLQKPFLLYRNSKSNIYGIWFYDKDECLKIGNILNKLIKESDNKYPITTRLTSNKNITMNNNINNNSNNNNQNNNTTKTTNNVDIFSMLSKAQKDFNTTRGETPRNQNTDNIIVNTNDNNTPTTMSLGTDVTSQSVMDFFAKAKVNTGHFKAGDQPNQGITTHRTVTETKPFLARLMSHPAAHTLEHIEKQQRSITPQPQITTTTKTTTIDNDNEQVVVKIKRQVNKNTTTQLESVSHELQRQANLSINETTNGTSSFHRIQSPTSKTDIKYFCIICDGLNVTSTLPDALSTLSMNFASLGMDNKSVRSDESNISYHDISSAPALMPPVMFSASSPSENHNRPLEPLTRNQLLQAFNYLLKSDPDFMKKLHEAYVKSFSEILS